MVKGSVSEREMQHDGSLVKWIASDVGKSIFSLQVNQTAMMESAVWTLWEFDVVSEKKVICCDVGKRNVSEKRKMKLT